MAKRCLTWLPFVLQFVALTISSAALAGPTSPERAGRAVRGWLRLDNQRLGSRDHSATGRIDTFTDTSGQALYYVVCLDPSGFVIVAVDDSVEPIICFASAGTYDPSSDNPLAALVSSDLPARLAAARGAATAAPLRARRSARQARWRQLDALADSPNIVLTGLGSVSDVRVAPFVLSRWYQITENGLACYNYYTPPSPDGSAGNYPCGCVATAMAQLMRFHSHPTLGIGVHSFTIYVGPDMQHLTSQQANTRGGDGSGGPYNWSLMMLDPDGTITAAQRAAIGALCYDAGVAVNMQYTPTGSGAWVSAVDEALTDTFGYSNAVDAFNTNVDIQLSSLYAMLNPNLDAGYPVLLGITGPPGGHLVLADGYGFDSSTPYHHLNLGWGGAADAWYNLPTIDTGYGTFTTVLECIYNVYTTGAGEIISGRVTDPYGSPLAGATVTAQRAGGGTYTASTNAKGIYAIPKVPASSTYTLSVSGSGYAFDSQIVAVSASVSTTSDPVAGNRWRADFPRRLIYSAHMDTNPGWTLDTGWAWGVPTGGGDLDGHDPTAGFTGSKVVGYNLSGDYTNNISPARYAKAGPIDCRSFTGVWLSFYRWLGVDRSPYDNADIEVSADGTNWTTVWANPNTAVADTAWQYLEYDLAAVADGQQTVYIRWGMGPTNFTATYPGWNIDDVEVTGREVAPLMPTGPLPTDGRIDVPVGAGLSWGGAAPYTVFDVYLGTVNPPVQQVAASLTAASFTPGSPLAYKTRYYWKIVAHNAGGQSVGPVWSFTTHVQGDITGDGNVNGADVNQIAASWWKSPGDTGYNAAANLAGTSRIDIADLNFLARHWGEHLQGMFMGCLFFLLALMIPRVLIIVLYLFSSWFGGMFRTALLPVLGLLFLPTTLLWFSVVQNRWHGVWTFWPVVGLVIAVLIDTSSDGGFHMRRKRRW